MPQVCLNCQFVSNLAKACANLKKSRKQAPRPKPPPTPTVKTAHRAARTKTTTVRTAARKNAEILSGSSA